MASPDAGVALATVRGVAGHHLLRAEGPRADDGIALRRGARARDHRVLRAGHEQERELARRRAPARERAATVEVVGGAARRSSERRRGRAEDVGVRAHHPPGHVAALRDAGHVQARRIDLPCSGDVLHGGEDGRVVGIVPGRALRDAPRRCRRLHHHVACGVAQAAEVRHRVLDVGVHEEAVHVEDETAAGRGAGARRRDGDAQACASERVDARGDARHAAHAPVTGRRPIGGAARVGAGVRRVRSHDRRRGAAGKGKGGGEGEEKRVKTHGGRSLA